MISQKSLTKYFIHFAVVHFLVVSALFVFHYLSGITWVKDLIIFTIDLPLSLARYFVDIVLSAEINLSAYALDIIFHLILASIFWGFVGVVIATGINAISILRAYRRGEGKTISLKSKLKVGVVTGAVAAVSVLGLIYVPIFFNIGFSAYVNTLEITEFTVKGDRLFMNREINSQTPGQLKKILDKNPHITTIVEQVVTGSNDDEVLFPMARMVRKRGLNTHLTSKSIIYSGAVDFFLAGVKRTMERGAKIGVHSWSNGFKDAKDYPRDAREHEMNRKYIADMLGKDDFYWFTIYAAPAAGIHEMSEDEIIQYKLLTGPIQVPGKDK